MDKKIDTADKCFDLCLSIIPPLVMGIKRRLLQKQCVPEGPKCFKESLILEKTHIENATRNQNILNEKGTR